MVGDFVCIGIGENFYIGRYKLLINEFELNPAGSDSGNEWVELYNPTSNSVDLTGWEIMNNDNNFHQLEGSINAGGYLVITFTGS